VNKATYDLVLIIFGFVKNFTKEYKYTIGESIKKEAVEIVTNVYRANSYQDKIIHLTKEREHIEVMRLYVRLLKDLHQINVKQLVFVNGYIENVSMEFDLKPPRFSGIAIGGLVILLWKKIEITTKTLTITFITESLIKLLSFMKRKIIYIF